MTEPTTVQNTHQNRVEEMMRLAGQELPTSPTVPSPEVRLLRARLILEEAIEAIYALGVTLRIANTSIDSEKNFQFDTSAEAIDLSEVAKELADISVVTIGTASACGIKMEDVLKAVDENNLAKFGPGGYRNEFGKWVKPPGHPKPDIASIINKQQVERTVLEEFNT